MKLIQLEEWQFVGTDPEVTFETHPEPMHIAKLITNIEDYGQLVPIMVEPADFPHGSEPPRPLPRVARAGSEYMIMFKIIEGRDIKIAIDWINKQRSPRNVLFYWVAWDVAPVTKSKPWLDTLRDSIRHIERELG